MANKNYFTIDELNCNCPNHEEGFSDKLLEILNNIREEYGKPIFINSAYRCPAYNKAIGGEENSAHMNGKAVDIRATTSQERFLLVKLALKYGIRRIGISGKDLFIHMDVDETKPQDVLWVY